MVLQRNTGGGNVKCRACVLAMDQATTILPSQLPLHTDYTLPADHECLDQFSGHTLSSPYTTGGAIELRRDGALQQTAAHAFPFAAASNAARLMPESGLAPDASRYKSGNNFTDSSSGSISASPSSAASSLAYSHYPPNHCINLPAFSTGVQQPFVPSSYAPARITPLSDTIPNGALPVPFLGFRSSIASTAERDSYPHYIPSSLSRPVPSNGLQSYADTSRGYFPGPGSSLSSSALTAYQPTMSASSSQNYGNNQNESAQFPWPNLEVILELSCEGQSITPEIHARVEKGFFMSGQDSKWTCYRRNYFSVVVHFELHVSGTTPSAINGGRLFLKRANSNCTELVQAFGMRLSAAVDGSTGKNIELVQHTPKRDNGPKNKIEVVKVAPTYGRSDHTSVTAHGMTSHGAFAIPMGSFHAAGVVGPHLAMQHITDGNESPSDPPSRYGYATSATNIPSPGQTTSHTFERVQFKQATANNGKRRASQQYFHLIVELFADVRKDGSDTPNWVKVAQRVSEKIVVRGRSPSHYQNEGQNGQSSRAGGGGGGHSYPSMSGQMYGSTIASGFGGSSGYTSYGRRAKARHYGYAGDSDGSPESPGSAGSMGGHSDDLPDPIMHDGDRHGISDVNGYQYYPGAIYEGGIHPQLPMPKIESGLRTATEPRHYAGVKTEFSSEANHNWHGAVFGRFEGVDSSRGYFPDLSNGNQSYS